MLPGSMNDHLTFDRRMKNASRLSQRSTANMYIPGKLTKSTGLSIHSKYSDLCISTDLPPLLEPNRSNVYSSSPPPPALSPASLSPTQLSSGVLTRTSSPSPPVIVAEIGSRSSNSSSIQITSEPIIHNSYHLPTLDAPTTKLCDTNVAPRFADLSSSTCSSSISSTSSSSSLNDTANHLTDKIPILEKISIALGSPKGHAESISSPRPQLIFKDQEFRSANVIEQNLSNHLSECASVIDPLTKCTSPCQLIPSDKATRSKRGTKKTTRGNSKKSCARKGRRPQDFLDSDWNDALPPSVRRRYTPSGKRGNRRTSAPRSTGKKSTTKSSHQGVSGEPAAYRRYLESPFLCLCQSGGTAASISKAASKISQPHQKASMTDATTHPTEPPVVSLDSNTVAASLPAHVVSPALRGFANSSSGSLGNQPSIPSSCPLNACLGTKGESSAPDFRMAEFNESRNMFAGLTYRPHNQLKNRDCSSMCDITDMCPWVCVFCGQDNHYLELGSLYGPYWLTDSERSQLPAELVSLTVITTTPSNKKQRVTDQPDTIPNSQTAKAKRIKRPSVISSAVTRSTAAQGRPGTKSSLKMIIKSQNTTVNPSSTNLPPRISPSGEVWFHLECVLWAPGTFVHGDGTIGNLGEAIQMALDVVCSRCDAPGAILSCCFRACPLRYHYSCALMADCHLNSDQYSLLCKEHTPPVLK